MVSGRHFECEKQGTLRNPFTLAEGKEKGITDRMPKINSLIRQTDFDTFQGGDSSFGKDESLAFEENGCFRFF
jgi:hypothetical protein